MDQIKTIRRNLALKEYETNHGKKNDKQQNDYLGELRGAIKKQIINT